ncbi:MAG: GTPase HflX, partial [Clostridia bacterium]|nr:GTPase HflX [Clostridia bacterium]
MTDNYLNDIYEDLTGLRQAEDAPSDDSVSDGRRTAILVSSYQSNGYDEAQISLEELERLLDTADGAVAGIITQVRDKPDGRTYIGKGKMEELSDMVRSTGAELVIFDAELSPAQIKIIEDELEGAASVIDRSMLILDIFAAHATSAEGRLQVELAQLKYTAPRLMGKGKQMSRLGGGIGTRGPGESKLEIDRRRLKTRIRSLEDDIRKLEAVRKTQRSSRERGGIACCAVVGYTNAGKSTLLNQLTDAGVLSEDKLFATLDPTTRQYTLASGRKILLTDTVGFIRNLPHHLISAFKSTLDE